uniref:Uncharacterized protein n=1 Tax=Schlesneria paludicola TaxID=360056 RepID=A0A7C4LJ73_9PLAN
MTRCILIVLSAVAAITMGVWWMRAGSAMADPLSIRRLAPTAPVLRGSPHHPVQVELAVTNTTPRPIKLAPLKMACNCQIAKAPDPVIAPYGTPHVSRALRYPPARQALVPVEFRSPAGERLARTEIVLEADRRVPYFVRCPELVEIFIVDGVSDGAWTTSATSLEAVEAPPFVTGARVATGADLVTVSMTSGEQSAAGVSECQRTYQLRFELLDAARNAPRESPSLRGTAVLELRDGTEKKIAWTIVRKAPLALTFDAASGSVRGTRRGGAQGVVSLRCVPEGSGARSPDRFEAGQPIVAKLERGRTQPQFIEARSEGPSGVVAVSVPVP